MHITLETDYAVRIVNCLVINNKRLDAKSISEQTNVTLRFSLKILRKLVSSGVVKSFKGAQGGYELNRPAKDISLYDIVETIEGEYTFCRCLQEGYTCIEHRDEDDGCCCNFRGVYDEISQLVRKKLKSTTFDSI